MDKGTLYIISTPIGNLADITLRALEKLKEVTLILSEDTRETSKVLSKYSIAKPQLSYRDQNHERIVMRILDEINSGKDIALLSDSGTPLISDPGFKLVQELLANDIKVESLPGPSAVISALVVSGLPTDKFTFLGFLPKGSGQREKLLSKYASLDSTIVIFESPNRVEKLLEEISRLPGNRQVCVANEMTKMHEKVSRGRISDIIDKFKSEKPRGEYVVLIGKEGY